MEKDDNKSYIDIVDVPPIETESLFIVNESLGSTELSKEQCVDRGNRCGAADGE